MLFINHLTDTDVERELMSNFQKLKIQSSISFVVAWILTFMFLGIVLWDWINNPDNASEVKSISNLASKNLLEINFTQVFEPIFLMILLMFFIFFATNFVLNIIILLFSRVFSIRPKLYFLLDNNEKDKWYIIKRSGKKGLLLRNEVDKSNCRYRFITVWEDKTIHRDRGLLNNWEKKIYSIRIYYPIIIISVILLIFCGWFVFFSKTIIIMKIIGLVIFSLSLIPLFYLSLNRKQIF